MRPRLAPYAALVFFIAACALLVAEAWLGEDATKYAVVALALSNASILWFFYGITEPRYRRHGRRAAS